MNEHILKVLNFFSNKSLNFSSHFKSPFLYFLSKGGPVMIPIAILSFIAIYIIVYKYIEFFNVSKYPKLWFSNLSNSLTQGDKVKVKQICNQRSANLVSKIVKSVINKLEIVSIEENPSTILENESKDFLFRLEQKISTLGIIAGAAPMLGFLGTVTGLIQSFIQISKSNSQISPSILSGGIYEAMITTAAGLFVGIIAYIGYNLFVMKLKTISHKLEYHVNEIATSIEKFHSKINS